MGNITWLTPSFVSTILTILALLMLALGFLIGFRRGIFGATYRFVVSLVVVLGLWFLLPVVTSKILSIDLSKFGVDVLDILGYSEVKGMDVNSIKDGINVLSRLFLGLADSNDGIIILRETTVDVTSTLLYGTVISVLEMLLRIVLLIVILLLNWTLFRFIFFIVYKCSKPKQENKQKQAKPMKSRLIGGAIGFVNMIVILLLISIPLSGIMNMAEKAVSIVEYQEENKEEIANLSFGSEVIELNSEEPIIDKIKEFSDWTHVYRKSLCGGMFGLKFGGTEFDCILFDGMFSFKSGKEKVSIRKEIAICVDSINILKENIIVPYLENGEFTSEMLDSLSSEKVGKTLENLSNLKLVNVAFKIGMESAVIMAENDSAIFQNYVLVKDIIIELNEKEIDLSEFISQLGNLSTSLMDLVDASGYKLSELMNAEEGQTVKNYVDALLKIDTEVVVNVFNRISEIEIIDIIFDASFVKLEEYINDNKSIQKFILLYPKLSVSDDKYFIINETKTEVPYQSEDLDKVSLSITDDKKWIIGDAVTTVDATNNIFNLSLKEIKITDEIKNIGALYSAFKELNITSFNQLQNFIDNGPGTDSIVLEKITYEKIDELFKALLNFKLITESENNIYVILNNILPNEYHGLIKMSKLTSEDLTSLVYAAKVVAQTGMIWDMDTKIKTNGELDYNKIKIYFDQVKNELSKNLVKSNIVVENIDTVVNYALSLFVPEFKLNLETVNWETEGEAELTKLFNVVSVVLKYGNQIFKDFYSISDEALDDIAKVLKDNIAESKILQSNMNNIINLIGSNDSLTELGISIVPLQEDEWTKEEIGSLFDGLKVVVKAMKEANQTDKSVLTEILKVTDSDIDTFLSSKFISINLVHNLCELSKEGNSLYEKIIINLDENNQDWYDTYEGNARVKDGELRLILTNAKKIINGIDSFDDTDLLLEKVIENVTKLNDNFQGENDEIGNLLSSTIITDTLIYYFENLEKLSEEIADIIVVSNDIIWKDSASQEGELRKLLRALKYAFVDENGNVIINELQSGDSNKVLEIFVKIEDSKVEQIFESRILLDTAVNFIEDYSQEDESRSFTIFLQNKERSAAYWQEELPKIFKGLKVILLDANGNLIDLDMTEEEYIDLLSGLEDNEVETLLASEVLVDTLAHMIIDMADEDGSVFVVSEVWRNDDNSWNATDTAKWRKELTRIIDGIDALLFDENGNSQYNKLTSGTDDDKLKVIVNIKDKEIDVITQSEIITDTIGSIISNMSKESNNTFTIFLQSKTRTTAYWQEELPKIFKGLKVILLDANGNLIDLDMTEEEYIDLLSGLEDNEVETLLASEVLVDTLAHMIIDMADEDGSVFVVSEVWKNDDNSWNATDTAKWRKELTRIIDGIDALLFDENGNSQYEKLTSGTNEEKVNIIIDIKDEELDVITESEIITDTMSNIIIDMGDESEITISNDVKNYTTSQWQTEIKDIIGSLKTLLIDENGQKQTSKLFSTDSNEKVELITSLGDDEEKISQTLESQIVYDTVTKTIKDLGEEDLTLPNDIDSWNKSDWTAEIKAIVYSSNKLLKNESGKIDIENQIGDVNNLLTKINALTNDITSSNDELGKVFESRIISETIITKVKEQSTDQGGKLVISQTVVWKDNTTSRTEGELRKLFRTVGIIYDDNIEIENFDTNKVLELTNDELDDVFDSQIVLETFYDMLDDLIEGDNPVLSIKEGTVKDEIEAKKFVNSIKVIIEEKDVNISEMDSTHFHFDEFIKLEDSKINTLLDSEIINYSASKKTKEILDTDLQDYVLLKGTTEEEKLEFVSSDLANLFKVIRDLEEKHNISYDNFNFDSFTGAINSETTDEKKNAKADAISDTLLTSLIIDNSIEKMISSILNKALDEEMQEGINLNMNDGVTNKWHDQGNNPGEFKKVFRLLVYVDKFTSENANDLSKTTNAEEISKPLKDINNSLVLCGVIPMFIDKATEGVDSWRYNDTSTLYQNPKTFTKAEWDGEIDAISDIVALVNKENLTDINSLDVKKLPINSLKALLKDVAKSRILDISCIERLVEEGVRDTFTDIESSKLTVSSVYAGSKYDEKVSAWNDEIDALIEALEALRRIESTDTGDKKVITNSAYDDEYQGVHNARMIGQFLDKCEHSTMLEGIILGIAQSFYPSITAEAIEETSLEELMVTLAKVQIKYGF